MLNQVRSFGVKQGKIIWCYTTSGHLVLYNVWSFGVIQGQFILVLNKVKSFSVKPDPEQVIWCFIRPSHWVFDKNKSFDMKPSYTISCSTRPSNLMLNQAGIFGVKSCQNQSGSFTIKTDKTIWC